MTGVGFVATSASSSFVTRPSSLRANRCVNRVDIRTNVNRRANAVPKMGLFGLGLPEVAVIAGIGIFLFGPKKIADMGKELGGMAGSVKKATSEFQDAMEESIKEADAELEKRKLEKKDPANQTVDTAAKAVDMEIENKTM